MTNKTVFIADSNAQDFQEYEKQLGWKAELGVEEMCLDTWRYQLNQGE